MLDEARMAEAWEQFELAYRKNAEHNNRLEKGDFAKGYLVDRSTDKGKRRYLKKMLPHLSREQREEYMDSIHCCRFCDKYFPLWYVSDAEWKETGGFFEGVITRIATGYGVIPHQLPCVEVVFDSENNRFDYKPVGDVPEIYQTERGGPLWGLFICKDCYEKVFNPKPNYVDVEEYEREYPAESWVREPPQEYFDWKKGFLSVIWDLPATKVSA
jgi:hypothetical protein